MQKSIWLTLCFLAIHLSVAAQTTYSYKITGTYRNETLLEILQDIEQQTPVKFYFEPYKIPYYQVNFEFESLPLYEVLKEILKGRNLVFSNFGDNKIVITKKGTLNKEYAESLIQRWESGEVDVPNLNEPDEQELTFGASSDNTAATYKFSGSLLDSDTKEPIIGGTLVNEVNEGTASDAFGNFELTLPNGENQLMVRYIGYQPIQLTINLFEDGFVELDMKASVLELDEVVVKAQAADRNVQSAQMGVQALTPSTIKELPSFLGEADVIKSLETLPGVSTVGEGATGFNVRGGGIDQNLILQDEALVFNSSHVLGFFSIFNPDLVQDVTLYKGNIPAQYGGRLSSVLDINLKDGNFKKFSGSGGIGLISSRLTLEAPIKKDKTSVLIGGRASYSDWLLRSVQLPDARSSSASFYDVLGKITHRFNSNSNVSLSYYNSYDFFRYAQEFGYEWRTQLLNFKWNQIWSDRLSSSLSLVSGLYDSQQFDPVGNDAFSLNNGISYYRGKKNFFFNMNESNSINAGAVFTYYDMSPESISKRGELSSIAPLSVEKSQGYEASVYINDEYTISDRFSLSAGLRYTVYQELGPRTVFNYLSEAPRNPNTVVDSTLFQSGESIATYSGLEPRIAFKWQLSESGSIKLSYNRMQQFIHLISNTTVATPVDVWQISTNYIPPQIGDNYSIGLFQNFNENKWETSFEVYYKDIENQLEYKDLPDLLLNQQLETEILSAQGMAYGAELYVKKNLGRWTGWLAYTFARTLSRVESEFAEETINNGDWFPTFYDQPHQITLFARNEITPSQIFTANFTYRSGRPITAPLANFFVGTVAVPYYSERNQFRIPDYHRLDLAYTFDNTKAKLKGWKSSITIAVYNIYFRENPFSVFFRRDDRNIPQAFQLSILGTALPSVTYNFKF